MRKYNSLQSYILAFHSCDREVGLKVLNGKDQLRPSENEWDWLGHGIYFWEHNPLRAYEYAKDVAQGDQKSKGTINTPFVIGCIIDLGNCLNLTEPSNHAIVRASYDSLKAIYDESGLSLPANSEKARILDCAVFNNLHAMLEETDHEEEVSNQEKETDKWYYDTVRSAFPEGDPIYDGCAIPDQTHIQICVRNPDAILGYFLPMPVEEVNPNL